MSCEESYRLAGRGHGGLSTSKCEGFFSSPRQTTALQYLLLLDSSRMTGLAICCMALDALPSSSLKWRHADSPPIGVRDIETKLDADWLPYRIATPRQCLDSMLIDSRWCRAKVDALVEVFRTVATT